MLIIKVWLWC